MRAKVGESSKPLSACACIPQQSQLPVQHAAVQAAHTAECMAWRLCLTHVQAAEGTICIMHRLTRTAAMRMHTHMHAAILSTLSPNEVSAPKNRLVPRLLMEVCTCRAALRLQCSRCTVAAVTVGCEAPDGSATSRQMGVDQTCLRERTLVQRTTCSDLVVIVSLFYLL